MADTPPPLPPERPSPRWPLILGGLLGGFLLVAAGLGLGWYIFYRPIVNVAVQLPAPPPPPAPPGPDQAQVKALWHLCVRHLELDALYVEVKDRIADMNSYLDADSLRRQANTVVRLTVVTILGLIGTVTTGFLGMNLLAMAERPLFERVLAFGVVFAATVWLTMYTIGKSRRLSDFLDVLSEEALPWRTRLGALVRVWYQPRAK